MSVQSANSVQNIPQKPITQPVEAKKPEQKESIVNGTTLLLGSLAALAVGAGIYFATKGRGETPNVSGNKFKTIIKKDGSMERVFSNGNTVNIKDNSGVRTITITDSNGKKICERTISRHSGDSSFSVLKNTKKGYNSEGNETVVVAKNVTKTKDKTEIYTDEFYYNEKGYSSDDTNLLKWKKESKAIDNSGKLINESSTIKERNKFDTFDIHDYHMNINKEKNTIFTTTYHAEHLENGVKKTNNTMEQLDSNGNTLWDQQNITIKDENKKVQENIFYKIDYKIDDSGKPILDDNSFYHEIGPLDNKGEPIKDYTSYYSEILDKGDSLSGKHKGQTLYEITDYKRNEDGVGLLKQYWKDLDGKVIESSCKQKQGKDVKYDSIIWD